MLDQLPAALKKTDDGPFVRIDAPCVGSGPSLNTQNDGKPDLNSIIGQRQ